MKKILNVNNQQKGKGCSRMLSSHPSHLTRVSKISNSKASDNSNLKILTPKQMLQKLQIALAHIKAGNTSAPSLNEIKQIIYSLH